MSSSSELHIGQYFSTWDSAIAYVKKWCNIQGFQARLGRSSKCSSGEYQKLTIVCQHAGSRRSSITEIQTNRVSTTIQMNCK